MWALFCVTSTVVSLCQPAVAQAMPDEAAGRSLSAFNLVIFAGIFAVQWGIGLVIDAFGSMGWTPLDSFRGTFAVFGACCLWAYLVFLNRYCRLLGGAQG
jgi:hypothetical protein